jgi:DeoR family fructose operon transcriptional repressor
MQTDDVAQVTRRFTRHDHDPRPDRGGDPVKAEERQRQILSRARADGRVEVGSLALDLDVAAETVRRDLRELVDRGVLQRVHGGAYPVESAGFESNIKHRSTSLVAEKRRIAAAAAERLHGAETVYVDEGVTPQFVAEALRPESSLTVVTASLLAASALAETSQVTVLLLGGRLRGRTLATVDHWALRMLDDLVIDLAFLGANGISRDHGLTTPDPAVAAVKGRVVERARRRVFVGLHTKFGAASFCRFAEVSDFEVLVTDTGLSPNEARRFSVLGPQVVRA